jgi:catalase
MPLPSDERIVALSQKLLEQFEAIFGLHPGFRPTHAKGMLLKGEFTPSPEAASLTRAPHMNRPSTPVEVRFSDTTGIPMIPDNDPNATPRGMAIRFYLADRVHTDIVAHSTNAFFVQNGEEMLEFLSAAAASGPNVPSPKPVELFVGSHPAALKFVQAPKPVPSSFARESFFGITAMQFANKEGATQFGRYRIVPEAGNDYLSDSDAKGQSPNFLFDELKARIAKGPIRFRVQVQLADAGDVVDNATIQWPEDRKILNLGSISLTETVANDAAEQQRIIFDPVPRVDGIEPSADPLIELRAAVYLISGRRRRSAASAAQA